MTEPSNTIPSKSPSTGDATLQRTLGDFRLLRKLGQGGMAEVWLAEQMSLERRVAVKLLRRELMTDEKYVARFQREASAAGGLNHPNIVQVHTVGEEDGQHYIAQEYVKGVTLRQLLKKKGPPELPLALHIMRQVASALKAAGDAGIVHRDIKPENIMLARKGEVKVADFGLAQLYAGGEGVDITQDGMTMGTPLYMSPEQVHGQQVDPRSDIYSFGVTCYHMLTGRPPFEGPTAMSIAVKHIQEPVRPLAGTRPDLPVRVTNMIDRMLAKKPAERFQSAGDLLAEIRQIQKSVRGATIDEDTELSAIGSAAISDKSSSTTSSQRGPILLALIFLSAGTAAAALGWYTRPADPRATEAAAPAGSIRPFNTPREQYVHAMFLGDNVDAFRAVIDHPQADRTWTRRAQEQLILLELQQRHLWDDAETDLNTLKSYESEGGRYRAEYWAGMAALRAYQGNNRESRNILQSQLSTNLRNELPERSPFRRLIREAQMLNEEQLD